MRIVRYALLLSSLLVAACGGDDPVPFAADTGEESDTAADTGGADATTDDDTTADVEDGTADADTDEDAADDATTADTVDDAAPEFESRIRIVHVSPDTPTLTLYLDGEPVLENITPYSVRPRATDAAPYLAVPTRSYDAALVADGGSLDDPLISQRWNLSEDAIYTVALVGLSGLGGEVPEGAESFQIVVAADDLSEQVDGNGNPLSQVRLFNAAIGVGGIDWTVEDEPLDQGMVFGAFSFDEHVLPSGEFTFAFSRAGETEPLFSSAVGLGNFTTYIWAASDDADGPYSFVTLTAGNKVDRIIAD